jgi:hypothetical protein
MLNALGNRTSVRLPEATISPADFYTLLVPAAINVLGEEHTASNRRSIRNDFRNIPQILTTDTDSDDPATIRFRFTLSLIWHGTKISLAIR